MIDYLSLPRRYCITEAEDDGGDDADDDGTTLPNTNTGIAGGSKDAAPVLTLASLALGAAFGLGRHTAL